LTIEGEVDRVYVDAPRSLVLREPGRSLTIEAENFPDTVVWNPWEAKCKLLADMPSDAYQHMLCVEPAVISKPLSLAQGEWWVGTQTLIAAQ
jgi:glucose-6-phosphate 1-epimerase